MPNPDRVRASSRVPLLVIALLLAVGIALLALEHRQAAHGPPALAPTERIAPPVAGGSALPASAPARAR